ncbi:FtsX-like permease family protein [Aeromicrobium halocynthiae]|uniref:FtsX-like permease family protein n=1 Tax=Aeromicrobium halocynthiae TaxID=560557 RepID=A0ABP5HFI1_9ACTN
MRTVTWRTLLARKVRLLLSGLAIVLGVAFVAGSFIFTDTIQRSFDGIVDGSVPDVTVRAASDPVERRGGPVPLAGVPQTLDAPLVEQIAALPQVERADGTVDGFGLFVVRADGRLLGGAGAPTLTFNFSDAPNALGEPSISVAEGREPRTGGEVALDVRSAEQAGYAVGDTVTLLSTGPVPQIEATLVGTVQFAGGGLAGVTLVVVDTATAQDLFLGGEPVFTSISVTGAPGVGQAELARAVGTLLPSGFEAATGDDVAAEIQGVIGTALDFLTTFLLVFGAIALVVGTFLIVNTFSILVAQRSRELALLRALGASRGQVTRSVLAEAFVVGLLGSTVGLLLGFALAAGLRLLFASFGLDLDSTPLVLRPRTAVVAYTVGVLVTMVAAYAPARRASRVPPVAAMRDEVALPETSVRRRTVVAVALALLGSGLLAWGLGGAGNAVLTVGLGVLAVLLAVALAAPVLARPVLAITGRVYARVFGAVGVLAWQNARRQPRRTAATASALMIGLSLVTTMSIIGSSVNASIERTVRADFPGDLVISNAVGIPFSTSVADDVAQVPGVERVAALQAVSGRVGEDGLPALAGDLDDIEAVVAPDYVEGRAPRTVREVALDTDEAEELGLEVGSTVDFAAAEGLESVEVDVVGLYEPSQALQGGIVSRDLLDGSGIPAQDSFVAVRAGEGVDVRALDRAVERVVADVPTVTVQDREEFTEGQRERIDQLLLLIYALLGLALVIAILGIVNTLALSVVERTREVGLLRAIGLSRRQLRQMVRLESVAIALLGAALGIGTGLGFGTVLQRSVADQGVEVLSIPWARLGLYVLAAVVVGVLAAVLPARRAARLDVLRAIGSA